MNSQKTKTISIVYQELKNREINPNGTFDKAGRWYSDNSDLISCRTPSRAWPYSEMLACRTKKYVTKCYDKLGTPSVEELRNFV